MLLCLVLDHDLISFTRILSSKSSKHDDIICFKNPKSPCFFIKLKTFYM